MRITCSLAAVLLSAVAACHDGGDAGAALRGDRGWSCAAYCVTEYHCVTNGDSTWDAELVDSVGVTAADAFTALAKQCKSPVARLVTHFECTDGHNETTGATLASSCARN
jgi:hypothetical protein